MVLGFLKKLFEPGDSSEKKAVELARLEKWLEDNTKGMLADLNKLISKKADEIEKAKKHAKRELDILEKAELSNKKIHTREMQIMEGNREAYIKKSHQFIDEIKPRKENIKEALEFCEHFEEMVSSLNKQTSKSYYVLQQFFSNESSKVAQNVRKIDNLVRSIKDSIEKSKVEKIDEAREMIKSFADKIKLKASMAAEITENKEELEKLNKSREAVTEKMEATKTGPEFSSFESLTRKKEQLSEIMKEHETHLLHLFAVMEKGLRKFERITLNPEVVNAYLASPVNALLNDPKLEIVNILGKMKENIISTAIDLKEKKKEKTIEAISMLTSDYFKSFLNKHEELLKQKKSIVKKINNLSVMRDIKDLEYKLESLDYKIGKAKENIEDLTGNRALIDIEGSKVNLENFISDLTSKNIDIKID